MTVSYPRTLPSDLVVKKCDFRLVHGVTSPGRTRGGASQVTETSDPYWTCEIESAEHHAYTHVALRTFLNSLRGGAKTFVAHDYARPVPRNYLTEAAVQALTRAGGGAFDGTFEITSTLEGGYLLSSSASAASRAPAALVLQVGDYIGITQSGKYSLHNVVEAQTANGSGVIADLVVEPFVNMDVFTAGVSSGMLANVIKPLALFRILPDSISGSPNSRSTSIGFTAISVVT